ncbi:Uncharacterised protein [Bordetella pertussis]|nr:Uncharacterised protein [Bordetella pertussis]CFM51511.1 Uncharacterised protein [Bordetella pertussis]CFP72392.1 Uncharacterised protein [Bordetella pertussis]CPJ65634.1 Uncharacterised protein [Bordetella pertussis]CPK77321.1 Uncharacterised protein [Bordetella pertussis]
MHAVGHLANRVDVGQAGLGRGEIGAQVTARIAFQAQAVGKIGLRLPAIEHQDEVIGPPVDGARGRIDAVRTHSHAFGAGPRHPLLLGAHGARVQVDLARPAVAHVDEILEGIVAPAQHGDRQAGIVLGDDGRARPDQHARPAGLLRMAGQPARAHAGSDHQRFAVDGVLSGAAQLHFHPALAGAHGRCRRAQPHRHAGGRDAGGDIGRHLLPGHIGQHGDPVVGERIVVAQAAQALAGLDQQGRQSETGQPDRAGRAGRPTAYNYRIVELPHSVFFLRRPAWRAPVAMAGL